MKAIGEICETIARAIRTLEEVKHVDLWNHNVEFIEQETAWERPAVFIEFQPMAWEPVKEGLVRGTVTVVLHIVTDWKGQNAGMDLWELPDRIAGVLHGLCSPDSTGLRLIGTQVNHNHEDLIETLETYQCRVTRRITRPTE